MNTAIERLEAARILGNSFLPLEGATQFGLRDGSDITAWLVSEGYDVKQSGFGRGHCGYALTACGLLVESHGYVESNVNSFEQFCEAA